MIYVKNRNLPTLLGENDYTLDTSFKIKANTNIWNFYPNRSDKKLAILSLDRNDNQKILIGTELFDYQEKETELSNELELLETDLYITRPSLNGLLWSMIGGGVLGAVVGKNLPFVIGGMLVGATLNKLGHDKTSERNIKAYIKHMYGGEVGVPALDYLGLND